MIFPLAIHKDPKSDYGVTVPDLPGCFSAGATIEEALEMAREAISLHLDGLADLGVAEPAPKPIAVHRRSRKYASAVWAVVDVPVDRRQVRRPRRAA